MSEEKLSLSSKMSDQNEADHDPMRRALLGAIAGTAALAGLSQNAVAEESSQEVFNAYNRMRTFDKGEMDNSTPWAASKTGNFDLDDPIDNNLVKMKMSNNLSGERTYVPMIMRQVIGREKLPGNHLAGGVGLFSWQLQEPDPEEFPNLPKGSSIMRSYYTAVYLDPETMEYSESIKNPLNGKLMNPEAALFAENYITYPKGGSRFVEEPQFLDDDPDKPKPSLIKRFGDDLIKFGGGIYNEPGLHQPRFTETSWKADYQDVMDPGKDLIKAEFNIMAVNKAFEKPWAGYTENDQDLLFSKATGKKVHSLDDLPDIHKRLIAEKYPERL